MKITLDKEIDAAYIYFKENITAGEVKKTHTCDPADIGFELNIDFDAEGGIILGIEVHNASKHLSEKLLNQATANQ